MPNHHKSSWSILSFFRSFIFFHIFRHESTSWWFAESWRMRSEWVRCTLRARSWRTAVQAHGDRVTMSQYEFSITSGSSQEDADELAARWRSRWRAWRSTRRQGELRYPFPISEPKLHFSGREALRTFNTNKETIFIFGCVVCVQLISVFDSYDQKDKERHIYFVRKMKTPIKTQTIIKCKQTQQHNMYS